MGSEKRMGMKTVCIIQQRISNTRLPGKGLLLLCGKPLTQHVIERVKRAKLIDHVILAIPWGEKDFAAFSQFGSLCNVVQFKIPENDLIQRFYLAAVGVEADFVVRISADNPCVEPGELDFLVANAGVYGDPFLLMNSENCDMAHDGFGGELYTLKMLEYMDKKITEPYYREHPHIYWLRTEQAAYIGKFYPSGFRLDVNTRQDYEKIRDIYEALYPTNPEFTVKDVIAYLNAKKETPQA